MYTTKRMSQTFKTLEALKDYIAIYPDNFPIEQEIEVTFTVTRYEDVIGVSSFLINNPRIEKLISSDPLLKAGWKQAKINEILNKNQRSEEDKI